MRPGVGSVLIAGLMALALAVLAGCGAQPSAQTSSPSDGVSTPAPSYSPLPSGGVTSKARLAEYRTHIVIAISADSDLIRNLAIAAGNADGIAAVTKQVASWASQEIQWLDQHPAAPCYQDAHDSLRAGITDIAAAAADFGAQAASGSPPRSLGGTAAGIRLAKGASEIDRARTLARDNKTC